MNIAPFDANDEAGVVALWSAAGLVRSWNDPALDIRRKATVQPELFLVGKQDGRVVATAMAGYDGHRGNVYYLAVHEDYRRRGLGQKLMTEVETRLRRLGCPKVNIMVRSDNDEQTAFYEAIGYAHNAVRSLGKRLIDDE